MNWFGDRAGVMAIFAMGWFLWEGYSRNHWKRWTLWLFPVCAALLLWLDHAEETTEGLLAYWWIPSTLGLVILLHYAVWMNADLDPAASGDPSWRDRSLKRWRSSGDRPRKLQAPEVMVPQNGPLRQIVELAVHRMVTLDAAVPPGHAIPGYCANFSPPEDRQKWIQVKDRIINLGYQWNDDPLERLTSVVATFPSTATCCDWESGTYATFALAPTRPDKMSELIVAIFRDLYEIPEDAQITGEVFL